MSSPADIALARADTPAPVFVEGRTSIATFHLIERDGNVYVVKVSANGIETTRFNDDVEAIISVIAYALEHNERQNMMTVVSQGDVRNQLSIALNAMNRALLIWIKSVRYMHLVELGHALLNRTHALPQIEPPARHRKRSDESRKTYVRNGLTVACDASWGARGNAYFAVLTSKGEYALRTSSRRNAEFNAIKYTVDHYMNHSTKLTVLSDCRSAISQFREAFPFLCDSPYLDIVYVQSHSGHPLHDGADRLALFARRSESTNPESTVVDNIVRESVEPLSREKSVLKPSTYKRVAGKKWTREFASLG